MACATLKRHLDWDSLPGLAPRQAKRRRFVPFTAVASRPKETTSVFQDAAPKLTPEFLASSVCHEVRLLQRRKQLPPFTLNSPPSSPTSASTSGAESSNSSTPLFTFKQVNMICERMVREREDELRQHYDKVLNDKLAEQYDAFVRFTQDQIHRRFANEAAPSYCS